jgi:plasmid stabilization system protein ParE
VSFTIKRTLDARKDLVEIWSSIAVHDEEAATRLLDRIDEAIMRLEQFPRLGREREDIEPGLRGLLKDDLPDSLRNSPDRAASRGLARHSWQMRHRGSLSPT